MDGTVVEVRQPDRRALRLLVDDVLEIGRECDGLRLGDPGVSRRHVRLERAGDRILVTDLGSTNGTLVNGVPITGPTSIGPGDRVLLGGTELSVPGRPAGPVVEVADEERFNPRGTSISRVAEAVEQVQRTRPPLAPDGGDGDTITIVFSDIESSTEHAIRLGDGPWYDLLGIHNSIVRSNLLRHGGTEIKSQGDGFMLTFPSARRAVQFAVDVQRALARWSVEHPDEAVRIRVGLHTGEALVSAGGDLFGKHVIVAARIANLAEGGEILASHVVREITSNRGDIDFDEGRAVALKGIDGTYDVHAVRWEP